VNKLVRGSAFKLDNLVTHLSELNRVNQLALFRSILKGYDELSS
jgi:hypothetical protein